MPTMAGNEGRKQKWWLIEVKTNRQQKQKQWLIDHLKQVSIESVDDYDSTTRMWTGQKREQNRERNRWAIECVYSQRQRRYNKNDETT